jgi:RNA polymerase sigma-70 factor (ECF subfamily)
MEDELTTELVQQAVVGDPRALQEVLRILRPSVLSYIERKMPAFLGRVVDSQDVVQDTWLEACMRIQQLRIETPGAVYRWLATIARSRLVYLIRLHHSQKRGGDRIQALTPTDGSMATILEELAVYSRTPSASAAGHELMVKIEKSLKRLPEHQAQAVQLRHVEGLSVTEAAAKMGRTEASFLMLCNRGLKGLRAELRSASLYK